MIIGERMYSSYDPVAAARNNDYVTMIITEKWRVELDNPRLCYLDLALEQQERFNKEVEVFKRRNPPPAAFHNLALQKDFYLRQGIFEDLEDPRLKRILKNYEYIREYKSKRRKSSIESP